MTNGTVTVNFTIGFGNNLFQYVCARLIAERNNLQLRHRDIPEVGIMAADAEVDRGLPTFVVDDSNYKKALFTENLQNYNVLVNGYFEDYKILKNHLSEVRTWLTPHKITNTKDVVLHLRLQNRLIQVSHNKNHIKVDSFKDAIGQFEYDRLHIVTDAGKWTPYTLEDIEKIRHEVSIGPNPPSNSPWVETEQSMEYMNHLIKDFADLDPIVHCNGEETLEGTGALRGGFMGDFNLLRSFNQVIVFNSTFSWWAATLSGAEKVAIFNPWKIAKPKHQRRNLGGTNFPGWFSWGAPDDLYFKKYGVE
tara:strand:+ start:2296 stop:3213 length:918 start_codon:yes stop_codon:yes gene_type:complete